MKHNKDALNDLDTVQNDNSPYQLHSYLSIMKENQFVKHDIIVTI